VTTENGRAGTLRWEYRTDGSASRPYLVLRVGSPRRGDRTHEAMRPYLNLAARPYLICADGWASRPYLVLVLVGSPRRGDRTHGAMRPYLICADGWASHPYLVLGVGSPRRGDRTHGAMRPYLICADGSASRPYLIKAKKEPLRRAAPVRYRNQPNLRLGLFAAERQERQTAQPGQRQRRGFGNRRNDNYIARHSSKVSCWR